MVGESLDNNRLIALTHAHITRIIRQATFDQNLTKVKIYKVDRNIVIYLLFPENVKIVFKKKISL